MVIREVADGQRRRKPIADEKRPLMCAWIFEILCPITRMAPFIIRVYRIPFGQCTGESGRNGPNASRLFRSRPSSDARFINAACDAGKDVATFFFLISFLHYRSPRELLIRNFCILYAARGKPKVKGKIYYYTQQTQFDIIIFFFTTLP